MEIKSINTKKLYCASNKLSSIESRIYAEVETAHKFMCEGFITETEFAAIRADREKKMAPYKDGAGSGRRPSRNGHGGTRRRPPQGLSRG